MATKTGQRLELAIEVGDVTTFRLRIFESEEDQLGYFLTVRKKNDPRKALVKQALVALSEEWADATVEFEADEDRQITSISSS